MGNQMCYEEKELRKGDCLPQIERKIRTAKKEIKKSIRKPIKLFEEFNPKTEILQKFINFHQDHLINVVDKFQFPKPGKDFMAAGLAHSFVNVVEITQYNPRDNNERKTQLLKNLKEDIKIQEEKSLFYVILDEFNEFYKQLCYEKCEKGDYTTLTPAIHNLSVTRVESSPTIPALKSIKSFNRTQSDNREKIKTFLSENECFISRRKLLNLLNEDHNLVQYIILSNATLFDILKSVLYQTYKEAINIVSSEDNMDNYIQNSLFFQQIIQHYIYDKALCIGKLIEIALSIYYQPNDFVLQFDAVSMEKPTFLDASLYPEPGQFTIIKEIDEDALINESCKFRQQEFYRSSSKASVIEMQYKIKKAVKEIEEQNIPYKELFKILQKIFEEVKPYRIFLHIQQLSDAIVQVYLQQRPQDQQDKYRELILAEDNKLSIILFLLQKFQEQSQCNLNRLYYKLRFMMDFDQVLDKRIKYEMDQSFVRFYACLEMITQTP